MSMSGYVYLCGDPDRPPVRFSSDQSYLQASLQAAVGTLIAHYYRGTFETIYGDKMEGS